MSDACMITEIALYENSTSYDDSRKQVLQYSLLHPSSTIVMQGLARDGSRDIMRDVNSDISKLFHYWRHTYPF